jgi:hypothetical protein
VFYMQVFDHHAGWGDWMVAQRLNAKDWATFPTPNTMQVWMLVHDFLSQSINRTERPL